MKNTATTFNRADFDFSKHDNSPITDGSELENIPTRMLREMFDSLRKERQEKAAKAA